MLSHNFDLAFQNGAFPLFFNFYPQIWASVLRGEHVLARLLSGGAAVVKIKHMKMKKIRVHLNVGRTKNEALKTQNNIWITSSFP